MRGVLSRLLPAFLMAVLVAVPASAQDMRASLFAEIDALLAQAKELQADVLAPKNFGEFQKLYDEAGAKVEKGQPAEKVQEDLDKATVSLNKSIAAATMAHATIPTALDARGDAVTAGAANHAADLWADAEKKFATAAGKLEDGDADGATKGAAEAESIYRDAELSAIKTNYFQETRDLLAQADKDKIGKYAPKTLQRSKDLLAEAEKLLEENRYDSDGPRTLAREAKYEVMHANHMAALLGKIDKKEMTVEELVLQGEMSTTKVAGALDVMPMYDQGYGLTGEAILDKVDAQSRETAALESQVADYESLAEDLRTQVAALESKLGGVSKEKEAMQARLQAEARVRSQFARIEQTFTRQEAQVYRQKNDVLIRLVGLNFEVGKSTIESEYFPLLTKVQNAMAVFPGCDVILEGHTDAHGSDDANLKLSQERADAVRQYLLANTKVPAAKMRATGYGESKPIASNETSDGRARNRRIDLVIKPNLGGTSRK